MCEVPSGESGTVAPLGGWFGAEGNARLFESEPVMRARDARAILFWIASTLILIGALEAVVHRWMLTGLIAALYSAWLLSRPRMIRLFRRLRGERWERTSGYFIEG